MDFKTKKKSDFCLIRHQQIDFYNPVGECSLRGTHESLHKTLVSSPRG